LVLNSNTIYNVLHFRSDNILFLFPVRVTSGVQSQKWTQWHGHPLSGTERGVQLQDCAHLPATHAQSTPEVIRGLYALRRRMGKDDGGRRVGHRAERAPNPHLRERGVHPELREGEAILLRRSVRQCRPLRRRSFRRKGYVPGRLRRSADGAGGRYSGIAVLSDRSGVLRHRVCPTKCAGGLL